MKKLSDNLKQMLTGLAHQDAGEFLPMQEKMKVLGHGSETRKQSATPPARVRKMPATRRIALISNGRGLGAPLTYVMDACQRQDAEVDLLIHGTTDAENISALERRIKEAGLVHHRIQLGTKPVDGVIDYVRNHPALTFMVAMPDDDIAKTLIEEVIPGKRGCMPVPLVLIEEQSPGYHVEQRAS
jgi:hypothetical protein